MTEQPKRLPHDEVGSPSPADRSPNRLDDGVARDVRLEDYLDHVCAPLIGLVPYARRQELRGELRSHLEALAASHVELGSAPDVALIRSLHQFGDPHAIARHWAREWTHPSPARPLQPAWRTIPWALGCFGTASLVVFLILQTMASESDGSIRTAWMGLLLFGAVLPVLAGITTGLLAPARHALGSFFALALLVPPFVALGTNPLMPALLGYHWTNSSIAMALMLAICWLPIGPAAAALGGWLKSQLALRPQQWILQ